MILISILRGREQTAGNWGDCSDFFPGLNVADNIPMWLADMDFRCPKEVVEAVTECAQTGIYGYAPKRTDIFEDAVIGWCKKRYGWDIGKEWIVFSPGVMTAVVHAIRGLTEPGDGVIIQPPVYYPFRSSIEDNDRIARSNGLILTDNGYRMNFDQLETLAAEPRTKLMILCSPHNPVGRVWSREELEQVCTICKRNDVALISDEIHADLLMKGIEFVSTGPIAQAYGVNCISCYAPSKTFNVAGLQVSAIVVPNAEVRSNFCNELKKSKVPGMNVFTGAVLEAAWSCDETYIQKAMEYIEANIDYAIAFAKKYTPKIKILKPQGTFLGWVDLRGLGLMTDQAERFFIEHAKITVDLGRWFGDGGEGFVRMNFACHRSTLDRALKQLQRAYEEEFP